MKKVLKGKTTTSRGSQKQARKHPIKIAIVHLGFFYTGGGERLVLEEAFGLQKLGYQVTCFVPVLEKDCYPQLQKQLKIRKLMVSLPHWFPEREGIQIFLACLLAPFLSLRFLEFDLLFGANQPGAWIAWVVGRILKKPYITYLAQPTRLLHPRKVDRETGLWVRGRTYLFPLLAFLFRGVMNWFDQTSISGANLAFANGLYAQSILEKVYHQKFSNLPAGSFLNQQTEGEATNAFKKKIKKPYILITNRHFPQKKLEFAIVALTNVLALQPEVSLFITGAPTAYTEALKELVAELGLEGKVHFLGLVSEKKLAYLYRKASCYVYTAPEEDFGMGIIEAMSCAVPVVAWKSAGPRKIIRDGETGLLAKPFDITDFSKKIASVISNNPLSLRLGANAKKEVKEHFSMSTHIRSLASFIDELLITTKQERKEKVKEV